MVIHHCSLWIELAILFLVLGLLEAKPEKPRGCLRLVLFCGVLCGTIPAGAIFGGSVGGTAGAFTGGIASYFIPFIVYGIWIQRTTGWHAWLFPAKSSQPKK